MLARLGEPHEAQRVAEECVAIAEQVGDPVLLSDSYNRLGLCSVISEPERAREMFRRALELVVPLSDVYRRVRLLNNIGFLELTANRLAPARESLESAVMFARTAGLIDLWARASLNLGVISFHGGRYEECSHALSEAIRLSAEAQQTEVQLIGTYNLGNLARELGELQKAADTYELATELADRIGQSEIKAGALAGMALCRLALGHVDDAASLNERLQPLAGKLPEWFQGRELVEALPIHLALRRSKEEAFELFAPALALAESRDVYGAGWLVAEFGLTLREHDPGAIDQIVRRYEARPELADTPWIRERFGVLLRDSAKSC
jgi:tetratricopeptide (TPR) repeat protein